MTFHEFLDHTVRANIAAGCIVFWLWFIISWIKKQRWS